MLSSPFYHQPTDVLENINHEQIAETSKTTVATIMLMASSPSRLNDLKVERTGAGRHGVVDAEPGEGRDVVHRRVQVRPPIRIAAARP